MKYGRTSMVDFLSRLTVTIVGFVSTIVLVRVLGQESYGTYVVVIAVLSWATIAADFGLATAVRKRVSEISDGSFVISSVFAQIVIYAVVAVCLWSIRPWLNTYIGIKAAVILIFLLGVRRAKALIRSILDGQHLVHISSLILPTERIVRSILQIALVVAGFELAGAFVGYFIGAIVAALIGWYFVTVRFSLPSKTELYSLKSYAQFSWLASIKGRTFLSMDTLILALFVSNSIIAVYKIAWNLASLFAIFGSSISRTFFPEMSKISSTEGGNEKISGFLHTSLAYSGLFIIPGLVGSVLIGDVILTIYGPGFKTGYYILLVLTFARLLYNYGTQFLTTLDAIDRPDLTFRINGAFITTNLGLNLVLTWQYGWYGAAAATTISAALLLILGYYYASRIVDVVMPTEEVAKQVAAAGVMAVIVYTSRLVFGSSLFTIVILTGLGASVYFFVLLIISREFRTTVEENIPVDTPLSTAIYR